MLFHDNKSFARATAQPATKIHQFILSFSCYYLEMYKLSISWPAGLAAAAATAALVATGTVRPLHLGVALFGGAVARIAADLHHTYHRAKRAVRFYETGELPANADFKLGHVVFSVIAASEKPKGQRLDRELLFRAVLALRPSIEDVAALSGCCVLSFEQCATIASALGESSDFWPTDSNESTVFHWKRQLSSMHSVMMISIGSSLKTKSPDLYYALLQQTGMPADLFNAANKF
jgi:hypothetical protein